jgi:hypothetical protein
VPTLQRQTNQHRGDQNMSQSKDKSKDADTDAETNEYGHELDRTVWRKTNDNDNGKVYHLSPNCSYLDLHDVEIVPTDLRVIPHHRPCKGCMGDSWRKAPEHDKHQAMIDLTDDKLNNSVYVTRSMWQTNHGVFHASQSCTAVLRADDFVELHIEAIPNLTQDPCDFCCDDEIRSIAESLNERFAVDNPNERLTVGDIKDSSNVWIPGNANQHHLVHLSDECQHMKQANNPTQKHARSLHDDRGLCKKCTDGWINQGNRGKHSNLAARLRSADNPEDLLE